MACPNCRRELRSKRSNKELDNGNRVMNVDKEAGCHSFFLRTRLQGLSFIHEWANQLDDRIVGKHALGCLFKKKKKALRPISDF